MPVSGNICHLLFAFGCTTTKKTKAKFISVGSQEGDSTKAKGKSILIFLTFVERRCNNFPSLVRLKPLKRHYQLISGFSCSGHVLPHYLGNKSSANNLRCDDRKQFHEKTCQISREIVVGAKAAKSEIASSECVKPDKV